MATVEKDGEGLYEKIWSYSPGPEDIDVEFGPDVLWYLDDDTLEKVYTEDGWQVTLTRDDAKQLIKDLQEWLDEPQEAV